MARWTARAKAIESEEAALHERLPPHIKHILAGKRLLLWHEVIDHYKLPDTELGQAGEVPR